jgi:hypothetical protein
VTRTVAGSFADIRTGDRITVRGTGSGTNALAADQVTDMGSTAATQDGGPAGGLAGSPARGPGGVGPGAAGGPGGGVSGTVAAVNGGTLTVTSADGTAVRVTTSSTTTVGVVKAISVQDLTVGQTVRVAGTTADGTVTATSIQEGAFTRGPGGAPGGTGQGGVPPQGQGAPQASTP